MRCSAQTRSLPQSPLPPVGTGPLTVHSQVPPRTFSLPKMMLPGANDCLMLLVQRITPPPLLGQAPGLLLRPPAQWPPGSFPPLPSLALLTSSHLPGMSPRKNTLNGSLANSWHQGSQVVHGMCGSQGVVALPRGWGAEPFQGIAPSSWCKRAKTIRGKKT